MINLFVMAIAVAVQMPSKAYVECVKTAAIKLEPSEEPANVIAEVAVNECEGMTSAVVEQLVVDARNSPEVRAAEEREHKQFVVSDDYRSDLLTGIRKLARQDALTAAVEARAQRKKR